MDSNYDPRLLVLLGDDMTDEDIERLVELWYSDFKHHSAVIEIKATILKVIDKYEVNKEEIDMFQLRNHLVEQFKEENKTGLNLTEYNFGIFCIYIAFYDKIR